ncbi:MAG: methyltransferase [Candidatus Poribacteria bacterium]|nr:methyltransferase [Candidatus Poribacteria bacterium]
MMNLKALKRDTVFDERLRGSNLALHTTWGLFSPKSIDEGTRLLINQLEVNEGDSCLDLGCGYGAIGMVMGKLSKTGKVYLVDKDFVAVEYAQKNVERNRIQNCEVLLSNAFSHLPNVKFDVIASNLPANAGKELLSIILLEARAHLKLNGRFYVVTISGLREFIKRNFREVFGNYRKVKQGRNHTVALAVKNPKLHFRTEG